VKTAGEQLTLRPTATAPVVDSTHLDATVFEKPFQPIPVVQRVADCLGRRAAGGEFRYLLFEPDTHFRNRPVSRAPGDMSTAWL
jgi:hypothetical protein